MTRIYYDEIPVGDLVFKDQWQLIYDPDWEARPAAFPLSLTMPLRQGPVGSERLLPWLANLLPETHLAEIGQRLKVSPQDIVGLLAHIGRDTAGAFSIGAPRTPGFHFAPLKSEADLEAIINALPARPFLAGERGVSMSLAGMQEKLPVLVNDTGVMGIPLDGTPSTYILKPDAPNLAGSVENEAFCLTLGAETGFRTPDLRIGRAGARRYLLVERYDRFTDGKGILRRLHQEDFCQLTGRFPADKYQRSASGRGIDLKTMFLALETLVSPAERASLLDAVIFNVLICNADSHAENYSICIGASGSAELASLYDLLCAAVYDHVDQHLPQAINGKTVAAELHGTDWREFAAEVKLSGAATLRRVQALANRVSRLAPTVAERIVTQYGDPSRVLERVVHEITKRCRRILAQL